MGLLDPNLNKPRTFELLRKRGAVRAILAFEGGHDQGCVESITLEFGNGKEQVLEPWYCGGYSWTEDGYVPLSKPQNEDEELSDLLEGPINKEFGSWGSEPSTVGRLVWNVEDETVILEYQQEEWVSHTRSYFESI